MQSLNGTANEFELINELVIGVCSVQRWDIGLIDV